MFSPSAIAIVTNSNCPLIIRTILDDVDQDEAAKLIYLLHTSLDIVDEKIAQPTSRDNFLGILYQCEQFKIYGHITTTKIKILCLLSQRLLPRENDIRQLLKNVQKAYIEATAMNPFYKPNEPVQSKRLDNYLNALLNTSNTPNISNTLALSTTANNITSSDDAETKSHSLISNNNQL